MICIFRNNDQRADPGRVMHNCNINLTDVNYCCLVGGSNGTPLKKPGYFFQSQNGVESVAMETCTRDWTMDIAIATNISHEARAMLSMIDVERNSLLHTRI